MFIDPVDLEYAVAKYRGNSLSRKHGYAFMGDDVNDASDMELVWLAAAPSTARAAATDASGSC